jgi:hypothetical protein
MSDGKIHQYRSGSDHLLDDLTRSLEKANAKFAALEHWFNSYATPEMSMAAMMEKITELEAKLLRVKEIATEAPELNMLNCDEYDVSELNESMTQIHNLLDGSA